MYMNHILPVTGQRCIPFILRQGPERLSRIDKHVNRLVDRLYDLELHFIRATLEDSGCEIELQGFGLDCRERLVELAEWASSRIPDFRLDFIVYNFEFSTETLRGLHLKDIDPQPQD